TQASVADSVCAGAVAAVRASAAESPGSHAVRASAPARASARRASSPASVGNEAAAKALLAGVRVAISLLACGARRARRRTAGLIQDGAVCLVDALGQRSTLRPVAVKNWTVSATPGNSVVR